MTLHLAIYLSQKLKDNFKENLFSLLELRRHLHHLTRMPDNVVRSIIDYLLELKLITLREIENEKPKYGIDLDMIEFKVLLLSEKNLKELQRRYKISYE